MAVALIMAKGDQTRNGKAFEYALAEQYSCFLKENGVNLLLVKDSAYDDAKRHYDDSSFASRRRFDYCAALTIDTMVRVEPCLLAVGKPDECLRIFINKDSAGEAGDVRDVVFQRVRPSWEIGFSAKNNNDAVKHSRLSKILDFGDSWLGVPCSQTYWDDVEPIFSYLGECKGKEWNELGEHKVTKVYLPLLEAFRKELMFINDNNELIPQKLIRYLLGTYSFYKIIKDDSHNLVIIKAFNIEGELNKGCGCAKPQFQTPKLNLPTRIVEFKMKSNSDNTINMILDGGWEISFRIHNASTMVEQSLKFDVRLIGHPPILFSQYLFQDNEVN